MGKTWLEVALNGSWGKGRQPRIPVRVADIVAEGIACASEGAAIIHVHAYDEKTGRQDDRADLYARIIEGIRAKADCIVYPTIPFRPSAPEDRFAAVEELARRGLIEWAVVDPGSVNLDDMVYANPNEHIAHGFALAARYGIHPACAVYEAGFIRLGSTLAAREARLPRPIFRFMFSEGLRFGFPPAEYAVDAYLRLLAEECPGAAWMIAGLSVDVLPLASVAVARGGHLRVGLEDAPLGSARSNVEWVRAARKAIERCRSSLASAVDIREALQPPR